MARETSNSGEKFQAGNEGKLKKDGVDTNTPTLL
jgi:hypothetical protein